MIWDRWREILEGLWRNKLRTSLTSLSVAWGVFILIVLLGFGNGLRNQVEHGFRDDAVNALWVYRGETSIPHEGHPVGRSVTFDNDDHAAVANRIDGVEHITSRFYLWGDYPIRYRDRAGAYQVRSCHPAHRYLEKTEITAGRYLNDLDLAEKRKVTVIGEEVARFLFRGGDPIGERIDIGGISYVVVGVFTDSGGIGELNKVYLPITTAQAAYGGGDEVHQIMFTVADADLEETQRMEADLRALFSERKHFALEDRRAIRVRNNLERFQQVMEVFEFTELFLWLVGLGTLLAGIVGVSNIMLVSVRERTEEFGLRKALGATPARIVTMVMQEAIFLTSVSGYCGLVAGLGTVAVVASFLPENDYIREPSVEVFVALAALAVLVAFGMVAGFVPAWRAARIQPIDALRDA